MRRTTRGFLLPGVVLTVLALLGVVGVVALAMPVLPKRIAGLDVSGERSPRRPGIDVPAPSPTARPTPTGAPSPRPVGSASTSATPTTGPTVATTPPPRTPRPTPTATPPPARKPVPPSTAPSCKAGSAVVAASADAYVDQSAPGTSFGSAGNLLVASRDRSRNKRALVRFALPALPAGCTLRTATLTMTAKGATGRRLLVQRAARGWAESAVTWANAPGVTGAASGATVAATRVTWTVTALVAAMRAGANDGFVVRDAAEGAKGSGEQTNLGARDGRDGATLTLRWA